VLVVIISERGIDVINSDSSINKQNKQINQTIFKQTQKFDQKINKQQDKLSASALMSCNTEQQK